MAICDLEVLWSGVWLSSQETLSELLFSAVPFQGEPWGLKANTFPVLYVSLPCWDSLLLVMQGKNPCPSCPHAFPWHWI